MLKKFASNLLSGFVLCLLCASQVQARDGYKIQLKFTDIKDSLVYLAHYYGKPLPTIYKTDSVKVDKNGVGVMQSKNKILGGIYMILLSDKKTYFDFLLDNGDEIGINITVKTLPQSLKYTGSQQNSDFIAYGEFLNGYGQKQEQISEGYKNAKTKADTAALEKQVKDAAKELYDYRENYIKNHPKTLLAKIFSALELPQVPEGPHYTADGKIDSAFGYLYYKAHYWDGFDLRDDRLINTPLYDAKLDEYINKLTLQYEDSINKEGDWLLAKTRGTQELFKYTLWWLTNNAGNSKIMGMDGSYVHFVENYYMKGDATWLKPDELQQYITAARKIAPNVIGNVAPELKMKDVNGKEQSMHAIDAKYTLLVFWSPDCGHCQVELPKLDSTYRAVLKAKGVKVYAISTYDEEKMWKDFLKKNPGMQEWTNVWDPEHQSRFREQYNIYMTPIIYLLDDKKIIRGKQIDYSNIAGLIDMLERNKKTKSK